MQRFIRWFKRHVWKHDFYNGVSLLGSVASTFVALRLFEHGLQAPAVIVATVGFGFFMFCVPTVDGSARWDE